MKLKNSFFYTIREDIKDEDSISGKLLVKAGMIKKTSTGIYMFLPMGLKVLNNIQKIVREEMNEINAEEVLMPSLVNEEVYDKSNRLEAFGESMFKVKDRSGKNYVLAPTHEELFTILAKNKVKSFKDLPFSIYQIQNKFRDEARPRYGLIRVKEFLMKDAYSFDKDELGLDMSYNNMFNAYKKIFARLGINYRVVKASTGSMGGILSEEFQAITDIGEDTLVFCEACEYASNLEVCESISDEKESSEKKLEKDLVETKDAKTIEEVSEFLNEAKSKLVKTLIYKIDNKFYALLVKGDAVVNETKVLKLLNAKEMVLASSADVKRLSKAEPGFVGPVGLGIPIIIDNEVSLMVNFVVGANKTNYHYKNVNIDDFKYELVADIRNVKDGDMCPNCGKKLIFKKGIEIGNTFKLGTKYSSLFDLNYTDKDNNLMPVLMGCYGIGLGRCLSSIVEQKNDDKGIIWPISIAPYKVAIIITNMDNDSMVEAGNHLYQIFKDAKIDVLLDDRNVRAGVKFNDMDLIGIPIRIVVGNKINEHIVEIKQRNSDEVKEISVFDVLYMVQDIIEESIYLSFFSTKNLYY